MMAMDDNFAQEDIYEQEEKCQKAMKTVAKAIFMRLVITILMIWIVISNPEQIWSWGLAAFVLLINTIGSIPLVQEYRKQRQRLNDLIAQEE